MSSSPPDRTVYGPVATRGPALAPSNPAPGIFTIDPSISSGSAGGTEPSIAVNPSNPNQIAITRFTFLWNSNADLLYSTDGGHSWSEEATIPAPGYVSAAGCPCDQTLDYGRDGTLYGTFLFDHVVTGSTTDPTSAAAWKWNGSPAQLTDKSGTGPDQPWLLVNRDPTTASQDNAYVAYDDFNGSPDARVAVSKGATPVNITVDNKAGTESPLATNPGLRLAKDPQNGWMYALYEQSTGAGEPKSVTWKLNRSKDGGATWTLNGSSDGLTVDTDNSDQAPGFKFGTVNALLGGVDHVAVDPTNHDVYVVYGKDVSGGNQIMIRQLTDNGSGGLNVGSAHTVSASTDTALPSVAVLADGTVGVLYISHDGTAGDGHPTFSAHFARSTDGGATWSDVTLQSSFESPDLDNSDPRQRVFGDYDQLKAVGNVFYGVYSGNRNGFGSSTSAIDPIFFSVEETGTITVTKHLVSNSSDPAKFNLRIDGATYAANVGNGGTTGAVTVNAGTHTVSETAGTNANLGNYAARIACSDGSSGIGTSLSGVTVGAGDNVTCTITNTRRLFKVG